MTTLKQALKKKLSKKELSLVVGSFDVVGDIAIIEIPRGLGRKQQIIANALLDLYQNVKVVAKKADIHKGKYRTQKIIVLAGEKRKTTEHKESGIRMQLDVEKCYFSSRLSTERLRISKQVKKNEKILVMFSGVAPYPLVIAKNSKAKKITGIEWNPTAHKFAEKNIVLNKVQDQIKVLKGDVRVVVPKLKQKFDRIVLMMPKTAEKFIDTALLASKKGTIIHLYNFGTEQEFSQIKEKVLKACVLSKKKCRILRLVKCGQHSPRKYRVCVDFKLV